MYNLFLGACEEGIQRLPANCVNYVITSPPYNMTTKRKDCYYDNGYAEIDNLSDEEYISNRTEEIRLIDNILNPNGAIIYNISYGSDNPSLPTMLMANVVNNTVFTIADIITWKKHSAIPFQTSPRRLSRICESVYVLVRKDEINTFITNKTISKVNEKTNQNFYQNYTNIIEARNNDRIKTTHKATFSVELVKKLIDIYVPIGSTVIDIFAGTGTTGVACIEEGRKFIGIELQQEYYDIMVNRLKT